MTVTRMATPRGPIPVTVDTFEASGGTGRAAIPWEGRGGGTRSADAYIGLYAGYIGLYRPLGPQPAGRPQLEELQGFDSIRF